MTWLSGICLIPRLSTYLFNALQEGTILKQGHIHVTETCRAVAPILNRVGDKWSIQIVRLLGDGSRRFNEIKREVDGISQRMLTLTLRGLERDGLVRRTVFPTIPPRVDYELTDLGHSLWAPVQALGVWAVEHLGEIHKAQQSFDKRNGLAGEKPRTITVPEAVDP
jgi:DNA-binding HxlR family transcriptional regulator